ncbi:FAD-binding oxidoreductase [Leptolyngbya sp. 'hensonii']|uniref:FAD-binding oxidoreductase n=1 Tax=Leptolyngbya sp. 'hensonii' TaxID=1922337 RepID=UPI000A7B2B3A|nr:FAD-binding oxidoreductase [Leptolyngbya sp. 'hensonii']
MVTETRLIQELAAIVGTGSVTPYDQLDDPWRQRLQQSVTPATTIGGMVYPQTQAELAEVVACAHRNQWPLLPCGSGTKLHWGGLADRVQIGVSMTRLNRLVEHAVGDLTVTVEAGMKFAELQATLAQHNQFLALDPAYGTQATIGGIVATADTGSWRQRYGGVRDMVLGVSFVRSDGQLAKAGGRVVKNVAGYDLMKLLTGSYGTLGILSQVTFRLYPIPTASQTVILTGEPTAITEATAALLTSALTPTCLNLLSAPTVQSLGLGQGMGLMLRFQSLAESVQEQTRRLLDLGQSLHLTGTSCSDTDEAALWHRLRSAMEPDGQDAVIACKIGVKLSDATSLLVELESLIPDQTIGLIYAGSGVGYLQSPASSASVQRLLQLRSLCQSRGGFLSVLQAPIAWKQQLAVWGYPGNALELMRRLKQQFDPHNLLNPCRFVIGNL